MIRVKTKSGFSLDIEMVFLGCTGALAIGYYCYLGRGNVAPSVSTLVYRPCLCPSRTRPFLRCNPSALCSLAAIPRQQRLYFYHCPLCYKILYYILFLYLVLLYFTLYRCAHLSSQDLK